MSLEGVRPIFLFAPGAGAPSTSEWMLRFAKHLSQVGEVITFDYPYMLARRRAPDRWETLVAAHREALAKVQQEAGDRPIYLAGKSMGSRVGCHVSQTDSVRGVICFGYPLVGRNGAKRDEVLLSMRTPVLFIQGSRDVLCPLALLESVRERMTAPNRVCVINEGNHSLIVSAAGLRRQNTTQEILESFVISSIGEFVQEHG